MNRLIDMAQDKLARMKRNDYPYPDNDIIVIPRGGNPGAGTGRIGGALHRRSRASKPSTARRGRKSSCATTAPSQRR